MHRTYIDRFFSVFYENDIFYKENSKVTLLSGKKVIVSAEKSDWM